MMLYFALLPLLSSWVTTLSIPVQSLANSPTKSLNDRTADANLVKRNGNEKVTIDERTLEKRYYLARRSINLTLKHAVHGAVGSFNWAINVAYRDANTLYTEFIPGSSTTGTSFHVEHFEVDQTFANGWDGIVQGAFQVVTDAGHHLRLRLRWEEFLGPAKHILGAATNSWVAYLLPGGEETLTQNDFSFEIASPITS